MSESQSSKAMRSLVIPVYKNAENIASLVKAIEEMASRIEGELEVVFVVDGSPDDSYRLLHERLPSAKFRSQLIRHSRNFGSMSAIRTGLEHASADHIAVMSADLQEPIDLILGFYRELSDPEVDVVVGTRVSRQDPWFTKFSSGVFWRFFSKSILKSMPSGGIDTFGCKRKVADVLLALRESNSSLMAQVIWIGFRRREVPYARAKREEGRSAWSFSRRLKYMTDCVFSFTDMPIKFILMLGIFGTLFSICLSVIVLGSWSLGYIQVPGYVPVVLLILFMLSANLLCFGIIGHYVWRTYENSKGRPLGITMSCLSIDGSKKENG